MSDLSIYPAELAEMSVNQLSNLAPERLQEASFHLDELIAWTKKTRAKMDAALDLRFGKQARNALHESGRDFGVTHLNEGPVHIKYDVSKKVIWSQPILKEIAERIVGSGDKVEDYIDFKLSVSEARYTNWPTALQEQFARARTVEEGKPSITLTIEGGAA